MAVQ
jgi:hypothetical protein